MLIDAGYKQRAACRNMGREPMKNLTERRTPEPATTIHTKVESIQHLRGFPTRGVDTSTTAPVLLQQALLALTLLGRVHISSQQQWGQELDALAQTNSRLEQDVTRLSREMARMRHFAYHDELTGLPNRSLLLDRLNQGLIQAARRHKQMGLLLLDLDGFKSVNDQFGHSAGDQVLRQAATRIASCVRGGDTACRYGGDEFVVMLPDIDSEVTATAVAEKIRLHLAVAYNVDNEVVSLTASIGVACYPRDAENTGALLEQADIAMYRAKEHSTTG